MKRTVLKCLGLSAVFLSAVLLLVDSTTFALAKADPITGRARGCYTALALLFGAKEAVGWGWTRLVELAGAAVLLGCRVAFVNAWRRSR